MTSEMDTCAPKRPPIPSLFSAFPMSSTVERGGFVLWLDLQCVGEIGDSLGLLAMLKMNSALLE